MSDHAIMLQKGLMGVVEEVEECLDSILTNYGLLPHTLMTLHAKSQYFHHTNFLQKDNRHMAATYPIYEKYPI